jgi:glycosyltransferase involved in cell wall biosynthesis
MALTVLQVLPALEVGGVERGTLEVAAELVKRGHRSLVISAGGRMVDQLVSEGSEHITIPIGKKSPLTFLLINKLKKILINENVSIVHARSRMPAWVAYHALRGMNKNVRPRFVTTVHGPYSVNPYSAVMTYGECVIAISQFIKDYILQSYPATNSSKVKIIYRGIDHNLYQHGFKPDEKWQNKWGSDFPQFKNKFLITLPARITRWKGHEDFIEIIAELIQQGLPVQGIIAGGYEKQRVKFFDELQKLIKQKNMEDYITFIGHRNDLKEVLSISNVVLSLAKEPEAFGRTALEALSLGTPVIAYNHGGAAEVLEKIFPEGKVPVENTARVAEVVKRFYKQPPSLINQTSFTLQDMLKKTMAVYESLVLNKS